MMDSRHTIRWGLLFVLGIEATLVLLGPAESYAFEEEGEGKCCYELQTPPLYGCRGLGNCGNFDCPPEVEGLEEYTIANHGLCTWWTGRCRRPSDGATIVAHDCDVGGGGEH
jgi:hypothetical protein